MNGRDENVLQIPNLAICVSPSARPCPDEVYVPCPDEVYDELMTLPIKNEADFRQKLRARGWGNPAAGKAMTYLVRWRRLFNECLFFRKI